MPKNIINTATTTTTSRNFMLDPMSQRVMSILPAQSFCKPELDTEKLGRSVRHTPGALGWTARR